MLRITVARIKRRCVSKVHHFRYSSLCSKIDFISPKLRFLKLHTHKLKNSTLQFVKLHRFIQFVRAYVLHICNFAKKKLFFQRALTRLVLVDSCSVLDFYESYIFFNNPQDFLVRVLNDNFT